MFQTLWKYNNPSSIRHDEKLDVIQGNRYWTAQKHVSQKVVAAAKDEGPFKWFQSYMISVYIFDDLLCPKT